MTSSGRSRYSLPYPQDVPLEDCWYARPQLLFTCYLRPKHGRAPKNPNYRYGPDDIHKHLVFFSTFEELKLRISGPMERAGVTKLYEPSPTPCLYVAPAANMVGIKFLSSHDINVRNMLMIRKNQY